MREILFFLITGYVLLVLESTLGVIGPHGMRMDGLFALLVWFAVRVGMPEGLTATLLLGAMAEGLTSLPPGIYVGAFVLAYLMIRYIVSNLMYTTMLYKILLVMFVSMNGMVIIFAGGRRMDMVWPLGVAQTVLNGLTAPLFIMFFDWLYKIAFLREDTAGQEQ